MSTNGMVLIGCLLEIFRVLLAVRVKKVLTVLKEILETKVKLAIRVPLVIKAKKELTVPKEILEIRVPLVIKEPLEIKVLPVTKGTRVRKEPPETRGIKAKKE